MNNFNLFFVEGIRHITDLNGMDHILFIAALCLQYLLSDWKKLLMLITAFTLGHTLTLALSTLDIISVPSAITEFVIALTILLTAANNFRYGQQSRHSRYIYIMACLFGLIHGLGFSTLLKSMLGRDAGIITELFAFNLGLEVGQLAILAVLLFISYIFVARLRIRRKAYIITLSAAIAIVSANMAIDRYPNKREIHNDKTGFQYPKPDAVTISISATNSKQSRV